MNSFKQNLRDLLVTLHIDLTKNLEYDRLTRKIIATHLRPDSNCIDVGCHKGEILDFMLKYAPNGTHYAFEPLPHLHSVLRNKYKNITIFDCALSDKSGKSSFQFVKNAPAFSGIKKRSYLVKNPDIVEIEVELKTLDELIPKNQKIDFVKIDVEGAEFGVLKGGINLLKTNRLLIIFESGKGASEFYGTKPADLYAFITKELGLNIYTLKAFLHQKNPISQQEFENYFVTGSEYYYVAGIA